jgi:hypothetical protein
LLLALPSQVVRPLPVGRPKRPVANLALWYRLSLRWYTATLSLSLLRIGLALLIDGPALLVAFLLLRGALLVLALPPLHVGLALLIHHAALLLLLRSAVLNLSLLNLRLALLLLNLRLALLLLNLRLPLLLWLSLPVGLLVLLSPVGTRLSVRQAGPEYRYDAEEKQHREPFDVIVFHDFLLHLGAESNLAVGKGNRHSNPKTPEFRPIDASRNTFSLENRRNEASGVRARVSF